MAKTIYALDDEDLGFHVAEWDTKRDKLVRTHSENVSINLAIAAYDQVLKDYAGYDRRFLLKLGARVIRDSAKSNEGAKMDEQTISIPNLLQQTIAFPARLDLALPVGSAGDHALRAALTARTMISFGGSEWFVESIENGPPATEVSRCVLFAVRRWDG